MSKLKLGPIADDKPLKVQVELPAALHQDLVDYAHLLGREQGQSAVDPARLIVPMLQRFIATDRGFAKARRALTPGSADYSVVPALEGVSKHFSSSGRVGLSLSLEEIIAAVGARADGSGINAISGR